MREKSILSMENKSMKANDIVAIDVGHARCTGASGNGLQEHEVCVRLAELVKQELAAHGVDARVVDFPELSNAADLSATVREVNGMGAALCVSLHCDASDNAGAKGAHVIYTSKRGGECAERIAKHLCALMPGRANKTVKRGNLYVLNNTRCPAVLCECGFITNREDAYMQKHGLSTIALAIATGVLEWWRA